MPADLPTSSSAQCICTLNDIKNQLLNENAAIRFQCLAYYRRGRNPTWIRCENSFENPSMKYVFRQARQILQQNDPVTTANYAKMIRVLFCKTHSALTPFKKYRISLQQHWREEGTLMELELLEAIRQVFLWV
jgi:hypothetical protein